MVQDLSIYLEPVKAAQHLLDSGGEASFASFVKVHQASIPDLDGVQMALVGVQEGRGTHENEGCALGADAIREALYPLHFHHERVHVADLGDIKAGHTLDDSLFAIRQVVATLVEQDIIPILIGGPDVTTLAMYRAYCDLERKCNIVCVDPSLDIAGIEDEVASHNHLAKAIIHKPGFLFNVNSIGYQRYLVNPEMESTMRKMFFEMNRLGEVNADIMAMEPQVRQADMFTVDTRSVRRSDAPGHAHALPNGLYGEQLCQLCAFAGLNERLSAFGLFEFNPSYDERGQTANLMAQAIWCFMDGVLHRHREDAYLDEQAFTRYRVDMKDGHELIFFKSKLTDRWWLEVPYPNHGGNRYKRSELVPCSYDDYLSAVDEELPDRWWMTYQKLA